MAPNAVLKQTRSSPQKQSLPKEALNYQLIYYKTDQGFWQTPFESKLYVLPSIVTEPVTIAPEAGSR